MSVCGMGRRAPGGLRRRRSWDDFGGATLATGVVRVLTVAATGNVSATDDARNHPDQREERENPSHGFHTFLKQEFGGDHAPLDWGIFAGCFRQRRAGRLTLFGKIREAPTSG